MVGHAAEPSQRTPEGRSTDGGAVENRSYPALSLRNVSVERSQRKILDDVSIDLAPATLTCLVGPNGSGKTTLLRAAAGLVEPSAGATLCGGRPMKSMTRRQIAGEVAYVPQNTKPGFDFSVQELVTMGRYPHQSFWLRPARSRTPQLDRDDDIIRESLTQTDTLHLSHRSVNTLSGGELQRVLVARCLAAESRVLLLDEPTAHLDLAHALELYDLCRRLRDAGRSVLVALHDLNAALSLADDVIVLDGGRVVATGPPDQVLTPALIREVFAVDVRPASSDPPLRFELPAE